ncbi:hypothetical protein B296_00016100 [Ensete ventricosum]|uniref:Uncharacterized protein n=1 Tax=Ensete ventricosum TaxID=4639 RepID=A0A427A8K9_ENSVE|nr:hypothetical protein B296_00016100 [Ensete ventricosum]
MLRVDGLLDNGTIESTHHEKLLTDVSSGVNHVPTTAVLFKSQTALCTSVVKRNCWVRGACRLDDAVVVPPTASEAAVSGLLKFPKEVAATGKVRGGAQRRGWW